MPKPRPTRPRSKSHKITISDIAREAGVSIYAVSRALNNVSGVNPETRERVFQVSRRLGFRPRQDARARQFALVIPESGTYSQGGYVTNITFQLLRTVSARGMGLLLFTESQVDQLQRRVVDGIFVLSWNDQAIAKLETIRDTPKLVINRFSLTDRFHVVGWDHLAEGLTVGRYLLERGHQRLGFVSLLGTAHSTRSRLEGFRQAHDECDVPLLPEAVEKLSDRNQLARALARLVDLGVDGIYFPGQERLGIEALNQLQRVFKQQVPGDLSIVAGENPGWSDLIDPPLTTVDAPFELLAGRCLDHMNDLIDQRPTEPTEVLIATPVLERKTVLDRRAEHARAREA